MATKFAETWIEQLEQVKDAKRRIDRYHQERTGDKEIQKVVEREIAGGIRSELQEIQEKLQSKLLNEYNTFCQSDINRLKLTELEQSVMTMRTQTNNYAKIDRVLSLSSGVAYHTYERVVKKIQNSKAQVALSDKQVQIVELQNQGLQQKEIAKRLGISIWTLKEYRKVINKKMQN